MNKHFREPMNGFTHLFGALLSIIGLMALVTKVTSSSYATTDLVAVVIFGVSLILLYATSAIYHLVVYTDDVIAFLRRLDHSMIFLLIAGSYTPFCLIALNDPTGWILFVFIMSFAVVGIFFKMIWFNCPRWLSTSIYVFMGWIAVFLIKPLSNALSPNGINLLILGGALYTIGAIIYATKPAFLKSKYFGFHEIFHIFVMLGSLAHFICVFVYVI